MNDRFRRRAAAFATERLQRFSYFVRAQRCKCRDVRYILLPGGVDCCRSCTAQRGSGGQFTSRGHKAPFRCGCTNDCYRNLGQTELSCKTGLNLLVRETFNCLTQYPCMSEWVANATLSPSIRSIIDLDDDFSTKLDHRLCRFIWV